MYLDKIKLPEEYKVIYLTYFGSKLYGTDSEKSDVDIKGIFVPSMKDLILKKAQDQFTFKSNNSKNKNTAEDYDIELYSIHKFFELLKKGDTGVIDMLFSMFREDTILLSSEASELIKANYQKFLTNNTKPFAGYCLQQTKKYGVKGSRYGSLKDLLQYNGDFKITKEFYEAFKEKLSIPYVNYTIDEYGMEYLEVLGRKYAFNSPYELTRKAWEKIEESYGVRSKKSNEESGFDAKAISHAYRVVKELQELLVNGFIKFPLKDAEYIRSIKYSEVDFEEVLMDIENQISALDTLILESKLKDSISDGDVEKIILGVINENN